MDLKSGELKEAIKAGDTNTLYYLLNAVARELSKREDNEASLKQQQDQFNKALETADMTKAVTILRGLVEVDTSIKAYEKHMAVLDDVARKRIGSILIHDRKEVAASVPNIGEVFIDRKTTTNYVAAHWNKFMEWSLQREMDAMASGQKTVEQAALSFQGLFQKRLIKAAVEELLENEEFPQECLKTYEEDVVKFKPVKLV